jgi:hypothetical protein
MHTLRFVRPLLVGLVLALGACSAARLGRQIYPSKNTWVLAALMGILVGIAGCSKTQTVTVQVDQQVLAKYRSFYPPIISISPDESRVVSRAKYDTGTELEGLVVQEAASGRILNSIRSSAALRRITWRPDGKAIAYFAQQPGTNLRVLFIWDLQSDQSRAISVPAGYAQSLVRWSPDGTQLAFASDLHGLVIVNTTDYRATKVAGAVTSFDWSPDSKRIALLASATVLTIIDPRSGDKIEEIAANPDTELYGVSWRNAEHLLILSNERAETGTVSVLSRWQPNLWRKDKLTESAVRMTNALGLPSVPGYLWHEQKEGEWKEVRLSIGVASPSIELEMNGVLNHLMTTTDGRSLIFTLARPDLWQLIKLPLGGQFAPIHLPQKYESNVPAIAESIPSLEGTAIRAYVSKAQPIDSKNSAALIRLYGESAMNTELDAQAESSLYLSYGVHCIHLEVRKQHEAEDLLAACRYAASVLGVRPDRIVLLGGSNGAAIALDAAMRDPNSLGILVLEGLLRSPATPAASLPQRLRILAFHGENDRRISPSAARSIIESAIGKRALSAPNGLWHVISGEDHVLHRDESQALVFSTVLRELGLVKSIPARAR